MTVTVRAPIRKRVAHDEPLPEVTWVSENADSYEAARTALEDQLPNDHIMLYVLVERG